MPEAYNADERFKEAVNGVLDAKEVVLSEKGRLQMMAGRMEAAERDASAVEHLRAAGVAATALRVAGLDGGFELAELVQGGYDVRALRAKDAQGRRAATDAELQQQNGVGALKMMNWVTLIELAKRPDLRWRNYARQGGAEQLKETGRFSAADLLKADLLSIEEVRAGGYSLEELRACGVAAAHLVLENGVRSLRYVEPDILRGS